MYQYRPSLSALHSIRNMGVPRYVAYTEWSRPADIVIRSGITILFPSTLNIFVIFLVVFLCVTIQSKVRVCYCGFVLFIIGGKRLVWSST
jgi:hypothetical protein